MLSSVSWSEKRQAGQIFSPLLSLLSVLFLRGPLGITALAYGFVGGAVAEVVLLGALLRASQLPIKLSWDWGSTGLSGIGAQVLLLTLTSAILSGTIAVDQAMAATLTPGSVAALAYGEKVPRLLMNLGAASLGTAALPYLSEMVARHDLAAIRHTLRHFVRLALLVSVPTVLALVLGSGLVVRLLFERGAFSAADTAVVTSVQRFYLVQPPLTMTAILFAHLLLAWRRTGLLAMVSAITFGANIAGNLLFMCGVSPMWTT